MNHFLIVLVNMISALEIRQFFWLFTLKGKKKEEITVYELNIVDKFDNTKNYEFLNVDDLINAKVIDSHSLIDIWDYLTN